MADVLFIRYPKCSTLQEAKAVARRARCSVR